MAAVILRDSRAVTTNAATYASNAFTPAANDLLVVFAIVTGTVSVGIMTGTDVATFTRIATALKAASADRIYLFIGNSLAAAVSQTITVDVTGDNGSGCILFVFSVSGMTRTGSSAAQQSAVQDNQAASTTPAPVFSAAALTGNPTLGCVSNATNPATLTPPTGWTEDTAPSGDLGFATPTTGGEAVRRDSGFTGTTITWGGTSASEFGDIIVELDTSALGHPTMRRFGGSILPFGAQRIGRGW